MDEVYEGYIERLINCGYSPCTAFFTYHSFIRELGVKEFEKFLKSLEEEKEKEKCG